MQLLDLVKPIEQMTDDELLAHVQRMRHNRRIERPAARARASREEIKTERKVGKKAKNTLASALGQLSDAEREALIKQLEGTQE